MIAAILDLQKKKSVLAPQLLCVVILSILPSRAKFEVTEVWEG